ncbi:hypothetical protein [Zhongshania sp.]|jgi:organic hydroperoxide reductase OsmC/OhrA|uniref:hypothetical protein n=1 Tax=Zhongshania sp. TaxID=1971902 RepID=UPI0039E6A82C
MQITEIVTKVVVTLEHEDSRSKAEKLLAKAEQICIVSNSLTAAERLEVEIIIRK